MKRGNGSSKRGARPAFDDGARSVESASAHDQRICSCPRRRTRARCARGWSEKLLHLRTRTGHARRSRSTPRKQRSSGNSSRGTKHGSVRRSYLRRCPRSRSTRRSRMKRSCATSRARCGNAGAHLHETHEELAALVDAGRTPLRRCRPRRAIPRSSSARRSCAAQSAPAKSPTPSSSAAIRSNGSRTRPTSRPCSRKPPPLQPLRAPTLACGRAL
jgi:hypothetical protein